jgi:DNA polymerase-3 subunit alpha
VASQLVEDRIVVVKGRLDRREDVAKLVGMEMSVPDLDAPEQRGPVVINLPSARCVPPVVDRLKEVLAAHPGIIEVHLALQTGSRTTVMRLDERLRVAPTPALFGDIKALLGQGSVA